MEKHMIGMSCLSFACLLLILGQARGVEKGGDLINRPLNDTRDNATTIIDPGQTIGIAGLLVGFKAFMLNTKDCIWLHVWRKALGGYPIMYTRGIGGYTTPGYTTPRATTLIDAVGYPYWMMIGRTTLCVRAKREGEVFTYNFPPDQYIRVEKDDVIGFSAQSSSPIPYSINNVSCKVNNMSLESQSSIHPRHLRQDRIYGFGELRECRTYSLRALINQKECKHIAATNVSKNLTISTTGRTESECWILQPAAVANDSKIHTELRLHLREFNRSCSSLYHSRLEIRAGNSSTSPKIMAVCQKPGRYSRYRKIQPITSGSAYVEFTRKGLSSRLINAVLEYYSVNIAPCMRVRVGDNPIYIESPGYPYHHYPSNIKICWILSIPKESTDKIRVVLEMNTADLQSANKACRPWDNSCTVCSDYIEVRDGNDSNAPLLAKWCNNTGKDLLETGSNKELIVYFVTDGSLQRGGFRMQAFTVMPETVACFHYIGLSNPAMIESPHYPNSYPGSRDDCWSIRARSNKQRILLTIKDSYLVTGAGSPNGRRGPPWYFPRGERPADNPNGLCATSKIDVRDGVGSTSPLLRRWCRKTVPEPILSSGPYLFIHFVKGSSNTARFAMSYQQLGSGACTTFYAYPHMGYLRREVNQTTSLGVHCWILRSEVGQLRIRWESPHQYDTTQTNTCNQNYIQVHDGESEASRRIGSFCHDYPIPEGGIESNGSALYIQWVVSTYPAKLQIGYRELSSLNCDVTPMKHSEMYFTHDGPEKKDSGGGFIGGGGRGSTGASRGTGSWEPQPIHPCPNCKYKANTQKCWTVTARGLRDHLLIKVIFLELQEKNNQSRCLDFLELYDGESTSDPLLAKFCGTGIQRNLTTTGRSVRIIFQSDGHIELRGFRLEISIVPEGGCEHLQAQNYNLTYDALSSFGNFRDGSLNKDMCWIITSPGPSLPIMVYVEHIRLELDEAVLFYDGPSNEAQLISKFDYKTNSGSRVISSGGNLTMVLQRSTTRNFLSFLIVYSWLFTGHCKFISLSSKTAVLTSAGFGHNNYPKYEYKCWIVTSLDSTHIIKLYAQSFVLENTTSCSADYMDIYDGPKRADDKLLHRWCGNQTNKVVALSSGRSLHVAFISNGLNEYPGFNIMATAIRPPKSNTQGPCVYLPISDTDYIETKNYGMESYPNNDYQCWSLTAIEPDKIIAVRANIFSIEYDPGCTADYLDVYDGPANSRDNMLHHWCGIHSGQLLGKSSGRSLFLVFKSDDSNQFPGFQLEVKAEDRSTVEPDFETLPAGALDGERKTSTTTIILLVMVACVIIAIIVIVSYWVFRKKRYQTSPAPEVTYSTNSNNPMTLSNLSVGERGLADGTQISAPNNTVSEAPPVTKDTAKLVNTEKNKTGGFWNEAAVYK